MRSRFAILVAIVLATAAIAQQQNEKQQPSQPPAQSQKKQPQPPPQKPAEPEAAAKTAQPAPPAPDLKPGDDKKEERYDMTEVAPVVTHHQITLDGKTLKYTATTGRLPIKRGDGKIEAEVFFVAYTLDGQDAAKRPVTFAFNGGPGSASIWLHMGALGPRRVALPANGFLPPAPYKIEDNPYTLLDKSDLVLVDAIGTGFSRGENTETSKKFWGVKGDIEGFSEFIRMYITRNERWSSPLFLLGESYGTTRAAGLSEYLQNRYGLYLNGMILVSSALNFQTIEFLPQNNDPYIQFLPSYAASAWYHKKLPADLQAKSLSDVVAAARTFAGNDYALALARGDQLPSADRTRIAGELSRFTGLPASDILLWKLRIKDVQFFTRLLRQEGKMLGRLDARFSGFRYEPGTDVKADQEEEYDPSSEAVNGPLGAAFNDYVRRELQFESDIPYELIADVQPWNFGDAVNGFPSTTEDLRKAMTRNPYLKLWVTCSYYDLATPFFGAENVVAAMNLEPAIRANLRFSYYESGHMLYIHKPSRVKFKADFEAFLRDAINQQPIHSATRGGQ